VADDAKHYKQAGYLLLQAIGTGIMTSRPCFHLRTLYEGTTSIYQVHEMLKKRLKVDKQSPKMHSYLGAKSSGDLPIERGHKFDCPEPAA
jgi:hypothetical protein